MKGYYDLLLHPKWKKKRRKILKRDGYKCTVCGSVKNLMIHHTFYYDVDTPPWQYPDESLLTVCYGCHKEYHESHELTIKSRNNPTKRNKTNKPPRKKKSKLVPLCYQQKDRYRKKVNGEWVVINHL